MPRTKLTQRYFGRFSSLSDIENEFFYRGERSASVLWPTDSQVLLADYECGGYEGSAHVFFRKNGKLYEVEGSHCSCYGLENQWEPDEVVPEQLRKRDLGFSSWTPAAAVAYRQLWPELKEKDDA